MKTFSKEEFKEFEKFVASPYFSRGRDLTKFLKALKKYYPDFESVEIKKEMIFKRLFPKSNYSDQVMRTLSSELSKMCESFLCIVNLNRDKHDVKIHIIDEMQFRGLSQHTEKMLDELGKGLESDRTSFEREYYFNQYNYSSLMKQQFIKSDRQDDVKDDFNKMEYLINHFFTLLADKINTDYTNLYNRNLGKKETIAACLLHVS
ncbi:hypothetical protein BH10BAC5_BH10BAC5_20290 [soil metagenome]